MTNKEMATELAKKYTHGSQCPKCRQRPVFAGIIENGMQDRCLMFQARSRCKPCKMTLWIDVCIEDGRASIFQGHLDN